MTVLVFANGIIEDVEWIRPYLPNATATIAADGGTHHLHKLNHAPNIIIGDQDSLTNDQKQWLQQNGTQFITHSPAKHETDIELALLYAAKHFSEEILLFGALGGRLDQTLANILLLTHPQLNGRSIKLLTSQETAWLVDTSTTIHGQTGDTLSLIPLNGDVQIERTSGLQWPLQYDTLSFGLARGISNVLIKPIATVTIQTGVLLCIHTRLEGA
jgi:thiamine pyrophosphokinase